MLKKEKINIQIRKGKYQGKQQRVAKSKVGSNSTTTHNQVTLVELRLKKTGKINYHKAENCLIKEIRNIS